MYKTVTIDNTKMHIHLFFFRKFKQLLIAYILIFDRENSTVYMCYSLGKKWLIDVMMQLLLSLYPKVPRKNAFTRAFSQIINPDSASVRSDTKLTHPEARNLQQ